MCSFLRGSPGVEITWSTSESVCLWGLASWPLYVFIRYPPPPYPDIHLPPPLSVTCCPPGHEKTPRTDSLPKQNRLLTRSPRSWSVETRASSTSSPYSRKRRPPPAPVTLPPLLPPPTAGPPATATLTEWMSAGRRAGGRAGVAAGRYVVFLDGGLARSPTC